MQSATQLSHKMRRTRSGSPAAADAFEGVLFDSFLWKRCAIILWLALLAVLAPYSVLAATLPGMVISNIASATYTSGGISGLSVSSNTNTLLVVSSIDQGSLNISSAATTVWGGNSTHVSITATNTGSNLLAGGTLAISAPAGAIIVFDGGLVPTVTGNQYSVPLPDIPISSSTSIAYTLTLPLNQISGNLDLPVTFTANSATVTVGTLSLIARARTAISTEFLRYDPTNSTALVQVPVTQYDTTGGGVFAVIPPPVLPGSANLVTFQPISLIPAASFRKGEIMFVRVTDADQNLDSGAVDTVTINLNGSLTGDREILRLSETGVNTGVFLGYIPASPEAAQLWNGRLGVQANSVVTTLYTDSVDLSTGTSSVMVDPYGRVFDSRTGQALNGISVTLVNANTGLPAVVFGDDGVSIYPSTVVTGSAVTDSGGTLYPPQAGSYRFPFAAPGNYRLDVTIPAGAGYHWPSSENTAAIQALPGAPYAIDVGSRGEIFVLSPGPPLNLDIPADSFAAPLLVSKTASKTEVAAGDFLQYAVEIQNTRQFSAINGVTATDRLPAAFRFRSGSLKLDGQPLPDPAISPDGRTLTIGVGNIAASATARLSYVVQVGAVQPGTATNSASARGGSGEASNTGSVTVVVKEDLMRSSNILVGRVILAEPGEKPGSPASETAKGIEGVRIYMENGTYAISDKQGRFHFEGVSPGVHVMQLDLDTLPEKYEAIPFEQNTAFAGRAWSQFADLQGGTLWRTDFHVMLRPKEEGLVKLQLDSQLQADRISQDYRITLSGGKIPLRNTRLMLMLPKGAHYVADSTLLNGKADMNPDVTEGALTFRLGDQAADWAAELQFTTRMGEIIGEGDATSKAMLIFDTPEQKNVRTPVTENVLATEIIEAGREAQEYTLRPQFELSSYALQEADKLKLKELAAKLADLKNIRLQVTGHTDNKEVRPDTTNEIFRNNDELSIARAKAVALYLRNELGLAPDLATVQGKGEREPIADNATEEGCVLNRRVEIYVIADKVIHKTILKADQHFSNTAEVKATGLRPGEIWEQEKPAMAGGQNPDLLPIFDKQWLEAAQPGQEWVWPREGFLPPIPALHVAVKHAPQDKVRLLLEGKPVNPLNFDGTGKNKAGTLALSLWRGINIEEGDNRFEVIVLDAQNKEVTRTKRNFHYSRPPVRVEVVKEQSLLDADGVNSPVIALRMLDRDGYPAREGVSGEFSIEPPYRPLSHSEFVSAAALVPGAPAEKTNFIIGKNGIALIKLQPTSAAGEVRLKLPFLKETAPVSVRLKPVARDWIVVGLANGIIGQNTLKGNVEPLTGNAAKDDLYQDGRIALYAKGQVKGEWLMTIAYDSKKEKLAGQNPSLFKTIKPGTYYTLYGDSSSQNFETASGEKLYLKIERDSFYALFGDYNTDFNVTELSRYSRSLTGFKAEYNSEKYKVKAFSSQTSQAFVKDEIRGQGISGPYTLSRRNIVLNSEKVIIQTRDRFRSEVVLSEKTMARQNDYDIDYSNSTLMFREPIFSADSQLNPIYIVVDFESYDVADQKLNYGARAEMLVGKDLQVGVTGINEGGVGRDAQLAGGDVSYQIDDNNKVRAEYAKSFRQTATGKQSGDAYLAEIEHRGKDVSAKAYVRDTGENFGLGQTSGGESGTHKVGAEGAYRVNETMTVHGQAYQQKVVPTGAERTLAEGMVDIKVDKNQITAGLRSAEDVLGSGERKANELAILGYRRPFLEDKLVMRLDREQPLGTPASDFPERTRVGADYVLSNSTSLFAQHEKQHSDTSDAEITSFGLKIKTAPWDNANLFANLTQNYSNDGANTAASTGLHQKWKLNEEWSVDGSVEHARVFQKTPTAPFNINTPSASGAGQDFTATSLGLTYNPGKWLWNGRSEYRSGSTDHKWALLTSVQTSPSEDLGLLASLSAISSETDAGERSFGSNLRLGLAYRPNQSRWTVLEKLDFIQEKRTGVSQSFENRRLVNNTNANYKANNKFQVGLQYGAKLVNEQIDGILYDSFTDLVGIEGRYNIARDWDVGVHANMLHAWTLHSFSYSQGVSVGHTFMTNMWVSIGYNVTGFEDRDFNQNYYTSKGFYVMFRMKFDQQNVKEAIKRMAH